MHAIRPLYLLSATQVVQLLRNNTMTVEDYARVLLSHVEERDPTVKAWAYLNPELVIKQAQALDQVPVDQRGPLHGVAVGIKDVMNTKDMPTEFGSPLYKGHQPGFDSSAVAILRAAGALVFGKTTTTEFTVANSGPETTNPHDPNPPLSLGCQTGGSLIRPPEGQKFFSPMFDTMGFIARSIEDLEPLADVFDIKDDEPPEDGDPAEVTVALVKGPMWDQAGPGTVAAMDKTASILVNNGIRVDHVSLPTSISDKETRKRMQRVVMSGEAQVAFLREYRVDKTKINPRIWQFVENSSGFTHRERIQALDDYAKIRGIADEVAGKYSAIITPSAVDEAPLGLGDMGSAAFNTMWTGFHMPVINVPAFLGANGMPIGISLVAGRFQDQHLLGIGKLLSGPLLGEGGWQCKLKSELWKESVEALSNICEAVQSW
ncbi:amidase [Cladorrhinum sp. PSN332]|nr:amidase [Cladorrhinum sp. PSN332]